MCACKQRLRGALKGGITSQCVLNAYWWLSVQALHAKAHENDMRAKKVKRRCRTPHRSSGATMVMAQAVNKHMQLTIACGLQ